MTTTPIKIKRSLTTSIPASLDDGGLAYTANGDVLFVGSNGNIVPIGGMRNPGVLTANQSLVVNSSSYIDKIQASNGVFTNFYSGSNVTINTSSLFIGNSSVNTTIQSGNVFINGNSSYILRNDISQTFTNTQLSQILSNIGDSISSPESTGLNYTLTPSVSSNALTLNINTRINNTPSNGDPLKFTFRNSSWSNGQYSLRTVSNTLSLTIPKDATLGHANATISPLYWYAIDNSGTIELAVSSSFMDNEGIFASTTAISNTATSSTIIYSNSARTNVPYILLGRTADTQTTAGLWTSLPSYVQSTRKLPYIKSLNYSETTVNSTLSATISFSDAIPQSNAGTQILSANVTPTWPTNRIRVTSRGYGGQNGTFGMIAALFSSLSNNALDVSWFVTNGSGYRQVFISQAEHNPNTTNTITYSLRVGPGAGGSPGALNGTYNGSLVRDFGGAARTTLIIEEITA